MKQLTAVVIGFGDRGQIYAGFAEREPNALKIAGVVEPDKLRRTLAAERFSLSEENCFASFDDFIKRGKISDCVINGTMDSLHIATTLPVLKLGYDVLLEKPITNNSAELSRLLKAAGKYHRKVIICHVLRYVPFYKKIKRLILDGAIGEIRHIETSENVAIAHASAAFIRGKWNSKSACGSSYLLQKCCHDFDIICWLNNNTAPEYVSSVGGRDFFIPAKAPAGSGTRCLSDCPANIEQNCPYSAKKIYADNGIMPLDVWAGVGNFPKELSYGEKIQSLKADNPHGKCIYKTDADIVDQQMTMIKFKNGSTAYHNLQSGTARAGRRITVYGTKGEIEGFMEDERFYLRTYNPVNISYNEAKIEAGSEFAANHAGGDIGLMYDFTDVLAGKPSSISTSSLEDSINSHLCVFAADKSMTEKKIIKVGYVK